MLWIALLLLFGEEKGNENAEQTQNLKSELILAVNASDLRRIDSLLGADPDLEFRSRPEGKTALHWAVQENKMAIVKRLILAGADVNTTDDLGNSLIHTALSSYAEDILSFLIEEMHVERCPNLAGEWPIHHAAENGNLRWLNRFLEMGQDVNVRDNKGWTPFFYAAARSRNQLVRHLKRVGATLNCFDHRGYTPLMVSGSLRMMKQLVMVQADINAQRAKGPHILPLLIMNQEYELARWALMKGADPNAEFPVGWPAIAYAQIHGQTSLAELLIHRGSHTFEPGNYDTAAQVLASLGDLNGLKSRLDSHPEELQNTDAWGNTLLILAAKYDRLACVQFLMEQGLDVKTKGHEGMTALMYATVNRNMDMIELLLTEKQDLMLENDAGKSVYYLAQSSESPNHVIEMLVKAGARRRPKEGCGCN